MNFARIIAKSLPQKVIGSQIRHGSVVSGPPSYRMSMAAKIAHGVVFFVAVSAYPTWVSVNIKNYRAQQQ